MELYKNTRSRYSDSLFALWEGSMTFKFSKDLKMILHPYAFVLKGGKDYKKDPLDYQLMMLQMSCPETIKSPQCEHQVKLIPTKTYCPNPSHVQRELMFDR